MAVRSTMASLITRVRLLINDPAGSSQIFQDQDVQDVLDATRMDIFNAAMDPKPTFVSGTINYLDYLMSLGDWEDDLVIKQFLTIVVTPSLSENIVGHWQFSTSTLPPLYITGKSYDIYRAAADLLERWAAKWTLAYAFSADGQSFHREQASEHLRKLALSYRAKQRPRSLALVRTDVGPEEQHVQSGLGPLTIDYMSKG